MKKLLSCLLAFALLISIAGCAPKAETLKEAATESEAEVAEDNASEPELESESEAKLIDEENKDTYIFVDSCGREVELPKNIERIAPSGPIAQTVLYALCPEKMVGLGLEFTEGQQEYVEDKYLALPILGNFYEETLNLESVLAADPQVVFDIGELKPSSVDDLNGIQEKTGLPTVFIDMEINSMADALKIIGEITGEQERAQKFADYIQDTLSQTKSKVESIPQENLRTAYYGIDEGLTAAVAGTIHSDVIDLAGGINVAEVESTVRGGMGEISMEQLLVWNPDVILFLDDSIYDNAAQMPQWQELNAIKESHYYEVPTEPFNWMGRPASLNRILGIKWLSNLLYPDVFDYDMISETQEFYKLFYHYDISEDQVKELLSKSTYK